MELFIIVTFYYPNNSMGNVYETVQVQNNLLKIIYSNLPSRNLVKYYSMDDLNSNIYPVVKVFEIFTSVQYEWIKLCIVSFHSKGIKKRWLVWDLLNIDD